MITKIISGILILVTVFLHAKHFWDGIHINESPQMLKMLADLGMNTRYMPIFNVLTLLIAIMVLFPQTFFMGNLLNAITIICIMALGLRAGHYNIALMEIPFLLIPLVLIWLKHPFQT
ncbi:MAG: hypothetical protein V7724_11880 [Sediminicola sp.]